MSFTEPNIVRTPRRRAVLAAMAGSSFLASPWARAQRPAWPQQPIKMVIAYPPGGGGDGIGRPLAAALQQILGVSVILDHRPGAGGAIAAQLVANSAADGYTIYLADNGAISVAPSYRSVGYKPSDFSYIGGVGDLPLVLAANPNVPAKDIRELAALSHTKPKGLSYGSGGVATIHHMLAEMLRLEARINGVHVAYKGTGPASTDLMAGVIDYGIFAPTGIVQFVQAGRMKALAVTSAQRLPSLPNVPTMAELGHPSLQVSIMTALLAPKNLPAPVFSALNKALSTALATPEVVRSLEPTGIVPGYRAPDPSREAFEKDLERWRKLISAAKLKLD